MSFTDIFIKRPVLATVVSLLILLVGAQAGFKLPIRQYPELSNTTITVITTYPGANADLIQGFITVPIQQAVASAEGIDTLTASSTQNVSTVTLNLKLDADPDRAMTDVLSKIAQVKSILPREANDSVVTKQTGEGYALMYLSFNSKVMTASQITDYLTRVVQPRLQTINGVANAQMLGGQMFAMRIWLDPDRMASLGVTPLDVRNALAANNFTSAPGQVKGDFVQTNIDAKTSLDRRRSRSASSWSWARGDSLGQARATSPTSSSGPQSADSSSAFDGLKAVFIGVYATPTANPLTVITDVRKAFPDIQRELPPGLEAAIAYDATNFIRASIWEVMKTLRRGGDHRHRGDLPVPRQSPVDHHPDRHHPAVADRRARAAGGARLLDQSDDAARARARHRAGGGRRHRRGGEHPPPYRGGHAAVRCGAARRARDPLSDHRHDHHARRGLCADRLRLGPDRRAVPRVRVHAGRRRDRVGRHRPDAVADDVLEAAQGRERARQGRLAHAHSRSACSRA